MGVFGFGKGLVRSSKVIWKTVSGIWVGFLVLIVFNLWFIYKFVINLVLFMVWFKTYDFIFFFLKLWVNLREVKMEI